MAGHGGSGGWVVRGRGEMRSLRMKGKAFFSDETKLSRFIGRSEEAEDGQCWSGLYMKHLMRKDLE